MKKVLIVLLVISSAAFAEHLYFGSKNVQINEALLQQRGSITNVIEAVGQDLALSAEWSGTQLQADNFLRNSFATHLGIETPADWDADVTKGDEISSRFEGLLIELNYSQVKVDQILVILETGPEPLPEPVVE